MSIKETLKGKREDVIHVAIEHGVEAISVFGSALRGEVDPKSDMGFLVEVEGPTSPWFLGGLVAGLENLLGRRVGLDRAGPQPQARPSLWTGRPAHAPAS